MKLFRLKAKEQNNPINFLLLMVVNHGNVIYTMKTSFPSESTSKLYQSLAVKCYEEWLQQHVSCLGPATP